MTLKRFNILVIGLGQIGYHDAEYMTSRGLNVDGYDVNPEAVKQALEHGILQNQATTFRGYDCYVIAVSTHDPDNVARPSFDALFQTAEKLSYQGKKGALVAIESTVTRGTSEEVKDILRHRLHVAHVPHRFYSAEKEEHGVRQLRVLGGCERCCTEKALRFYEKTLGIPVHRVSSAEIAELSKVVENSYRFLEIAFAEELKMLCDSRGWSYDELREAVNSKWNVKILEARHGIGGHCLPKDAQMYLDLSAKATETSIINSAIAADREYKTRLSLEKGLHVIVPNALLYDQTA